MVDMRLAKASVPGTSPGIRPGAVVDEVEVVLLEVAVVEVEEDEDEEEVVVLAVVLVEPVVGTTGGRLRPMTLKSPGEVCLSWSRAFWIWTTAAKAWEGTEMEGQAGGGGEG